MSISTQPVVSLTQAAELIVSTGQFVTYLLEGEPGIGKSALLQTIGKHTSMETRYLDCALTDLGDLQMPYVDNEITRFVPNELFKSDKPFVIMLDELGKANRSVQNTMLTLLHEHRIGNTYLPKGSIVFATTNLSTDGVGDRLEAHALNRMTPVRVKKPTAEEWMGWAVDNEVDPVIIAWVKDNAHCMESYVDLTSEQAKENPYIFNPHKQQAAFVSPRSLEKVSHITKRRAHIETEAVLAAMAGTVSEAAARDMMAYFDIADELPSWESIITSPDKALVPANPIASIILVVGAAMKVNAQTIANWMRYMEKLPREVQFLFVNSVMRNSAVSAVITTHDAFTNWCINNEWAV